MSYEDKKPDEAKAEPITPASSTFGHLLVKRDEPPIPYKTWRPKRRRKGKLNDGQWAPGYGPDAKKKRPDE